MDGPRGATPRFAFGTLVATVIRRMRRLESFRHLARLALGATLLTLSVAFEPLAILVTGPYFLLGTFAFQHDLMHGALRWPKRWRELALSVVGATMFMSGHATRTMHLLHHRDPNGRNDLEGNTADLPLLRALLVTPKLALEIRPAAWRHAAPQVRRRQVMEHATNLMLALLVVASGIAGLQLYLALTIAFQLTMPFWAGRVPHRVPRWARRVARVVAQLGSVTAMSLAHHELHHDHPRLPTHALSRLADQMA